MFKSWTTEPDATVRLDESSPGGKRVLINFAIFQICWLACVLSGAAGLPILGVAAVGAAAGYHLRAAVQPPREALLLFCAGGIGMLWDGQLAGYGWLIYPSGMIHQWLAPTWIVAMWVSFATTLNVALRWLHGRFGLAAAFGAVGGPIAYWAGSKLGGVSFSDPVIALSAVSVGWGLITPILVALARRLDGFAEGSPASSRNGRVTEAEQRV